MKLYQNDKVCEYNKIKLLYLILIVYIGIHPIVVLLNYLNINISIKKSFIVISILLVYLSISILNILKNKYINKNISLENFTLLLVLTMVIISFTYLKEYQNVIYKSGYTYKTISGINYMFIFLRDTIIYYIAFALIGENIKDLLILFKNKWINFINKIIYINIIILLIIISIKNNIGITSVIFKGNIDNGVYLYVGDTFAILSILLFNYVKYKKLFLLNSLFWIYKIGSRTTLICFILVLVFIIVKNNIFRIKIKNVIIALLISPVIFLSIFTMFKYINIELDDRMITVFSTNNIQEDSSFSSRKVINKRNMDDLKNIWFKGRVFREFKVSGQTGYYSHNMISFWIEFGIVPFVLLVVFIIYSIYNILQSILYDEKIIETIGCLLILLLPMVIFSRSYNYPYIWLIIFMASSLRHLMKKEYFKVKRRVSFEDRYNNIS